MRKNITDGRWSEKLESFDPAAAAEWASRKFQHQDIASYGRAITLLLCAYFLSGLLSLTLGRFIPEPSPSRGFRGAVGGSRKSIDDYGVIFSRNLFSSKGIIPGEEGQSGAPQDQGGPPVKSSLPLNLVGTMILKDELESIATIEDKAASMVFPLREEDEIPSKIKVVRIEPTRVIFVNSATGRREYIELPVDAAVSNAHLGASKKVAGAGVEQVAPNNFNVSRSEVDKTLADFNNVLTQARAVPNFENGAPNGYKLFQIVPGSIYEKLGLLNGDVIAGLNGEGINDPGKAFEMLKELKTAKHLELQIKRDGRTQNFAYDIN